MAGAARSQHGMFLFMLTAVYMLGGINFAQLKLADAITEKVVG